MKRACIEVERPGRSASSGLGLFLTEHGGGLVVKALLSGGAAERSAQIQVGDRVIAVSAALSQLMSEVMLNIFDFQQHQQKQ
jgi:hypothetical protein